MRSLSPDYLHAREAVIRSGAAVRAGMGRWLLPFLFLLTAAEAGGVQCADGSDEESCASGQSACREDEFRCWPDAECYPRAFLCDRHPDCPDGRDESGCAYQATGTPQATEGTPPEAPGVPESMAAERWAILTIVALLVLAAAALAVSVLRVSRNAKPLRLSFCLDQASEELMRKEQP